MRMAPSFTPFGAAKCLLILFFSLLPTTIIPSEIKESETSPPASLVYNVDCGCYKPPPPPPKCPPPPPPVDPVIRRSIKAIRTFKKSITSDPYNKTATWSGNELCINKKAYEGFFCYVPRGGDKKRVGGIYFNGFNFGGNLLSLNNFVESFNELVVIHVNSNNFIRAPGVPVKNFPTLFELDLSNNKLAGTFPTDVLEATNLTYLDLRFNMLTGPVHPQVFTLDLDALFLNNNFFSGPLPDNLGSTPVFFLTLANNLFSGQIPPSIGNASFLREVLFLNNKLTGCLPYQIGLLKNSTVFDASINQLTGPIPQSFGCLENLEILNLTSNHLYGAVPESLCKLKALEELSLSSNYFTQIGPECRNLLEKKVLDIDNNCILDLPNQRSAQVCKEFFLHYQKCPDHKSMLYVPCDIDESPRKGGPHHPHKKQKRGSSSTYAALRP
nr:Leucine-rich repeat protein [Ipomoea batatas]